ncbi:MAG: hypothetical protein ABSC48_07735 [Terracidiphilus sp.]|jgi:hypothetical protein
MLKRLAILVLLLAIVQALDPAPRRATTSACNGGSNDKNSSQGNQNTASPTPPLVTPQVKAVSANPHGSDVASETTNTVHSVKVTSIPSIAITDIHKPWWEYFLDWGQWVFAGVLAYVGWQQVRLLRRQEKILFGARKEIHTQARHMSRQADLMSSNNEVALVAANAAKESAKAANDQIEMMKSKERARIQVTPLDFDAVDPTEPNKIMIDFVNIGPTNAFDVRVEAGAKVTVEGFKPEQGEYTDLAIPTLLRPEKLESSWVVWDFPRRWRDEIVDERAKVTFEVVGQIKYRDVFDTTHTEDFSYRMNVYGIEDLPGNLVKLKFMRNWHPFDLHPGEWEF